ncbi:hypothetical protein FB451DRAFT_1167711 [Mycena latifolia]|nr:hypothetical protein FB451DRAFT_1167711 [Mycena latifolia]
MTRCAKKLRQQDQGPSTNFPPTLRMALLQFSNGNTKVSDTLTSSLAGTSSLDKNPIKMSVFEGSPTTAIRESNIAIAVLVARAERAAFASAPWATTDAPQERACRAGVAYLGLFHVLSLLGSAELPAMVTVSFTEDAIPYIAFGFTIAEAPFPQPEEARIVE